MTDLVVVYVTAPDAEVAGRIAHALVGEELAACCTLVPGVRSVYRWEGRVQEDAEILLVVKTRGASVDALARRVVELHPYAVPEVIACPIVDGHGPYLDWVRAGTRDG